MILEPEIQAFIAHSESLLWPGYWEAPIEEQRRLYDALCRAYDFGRPAGLEVRDLAIPGPAGEIPARLYRPRGSSLQAGLVYLQGGSWYLGGLDSHDSIVAELAGRTGVTVIAVDYRLAPENRFPAAYQDGLAALAWIADQASHLSIDPSRLGVGGDSAGGNLAAALSLAARDRDGPAVKGQILIYPALDCLDAYGRANTGAETPLLNAEEIRFALKCYLGAESMPADVRVAPLAAGDLSGLPPATILAAEADPLLADAETYGRRLDEAGVPVELEVAKGVVHGFLRARRMSPESGRAFDWLCDAMKRLLCDCDRPHRSDRTAGGQGSGA